MVNGAVCGFLVLGAGTKDGWTNSTQTRVAYFLFPFCGKKKNRIQNDAFLSHLSEESMKGILNGWFLFSFSEGSKKGILNHAFLFHLSEESVKGIQNDEFLFPFI